MTLAPYFSDLKQQQEANRLGMWTFLVTEVLFIGAGFAAHTVYLFVYPEGFAEASSELNLMLSTINTVVLLTSSLTMALAVHAAQTDRTRALSWFLLLTIVLGTIFLGIKGFEYYEEYQHHLIPGLNFAGEGFSQPGPAFLFFSFYFIMTGLHALHMLVGMVILAYLTYRARQKRYSSRNYDPIELMGLFWHFVDIVWVFIFAAFYLL